jgi:hypothetical protein
MKDSPGRGADVLGEAAVAVLAQHGPGLAELFVALLAVGALTAGHQVMQTDPVSGSEVLDSRTGARNLTCNFMA